MAKAKNITRINRKSRRAKGLIRQSNHVIDTEAQRLLLATIPASWVVTDFSTDYGKDYHIELAEENQFVKKAFYLQLKGTRSPKYTVDGNGIVHQLLRHHIEYWLEEVTLPIFLVVIDKKNNVGYWLFLQEALTKHKLRDQQGKLSVTIPVLNKLTETRSLQAAVESSHEFMIKFRAPTAQQSIQDRLSELSKMDPRIAVGYQQFGKSGEFILSAKCNVPLTISVTQPDAVKRFNKTVIEQGRVAVFDRTEFEIIGSPLLSSLMSKGEVAIRISKSVLARMELRAYKDGKEVFHFPELPVELFGGKSSYELQYKPEFSPFNITHSLEGLTFTIDPVRWSDQGIMDLVDFDFTRDLVSALCESDTFQATVYIGDIRLGEAIMNLPYSDRYKLLNRYICTLAELRFICKCLQINPVLHENTLYDLSPLEIQKWYCVFKNGKFVAKVNGLTAETVTTKDKIDKLRAEFVSSMTVFTMVPGENHIEIFGEKHLLPAMTWDFHNLGALNVRKLRASRVQTYRLQFGSTPETLYVIRQQTEEDSKLQDGLELLGQYP